LNKFKKKNSLNEEENLIINYPKAPAPATRFSQFALSSARSTMFSTDMNYGAAVSKLAMYFWKLFMGRPRLRRPWLGQKKTNFLAGSSSFFSSSSGFLSSFFDPYLRTCPR
jgi:hypothetical protein